MRFFLVAILSVSFVLASCAKPVDPGDSDKRVADSRAVSMDFMKTLKTELMGALKQGGASKAIEVCQKKAPAIAAQLSKKHGWEVSRTSLKLRNPANAPDAWEQAVLEKFEVRRTKGEDPKTLEYYEIVKQGDKKVFRYMKAIPTGGLCLQCHGEKLDPVVQQKLKQLYPQDKATGFKAGDIRGAFTIKQSM